MVGDGSHDIAAANAAGVTSIWLSHHEERDLGAPGPPPPAPPPPPTHTIATLQELLPLLTTRN
jgi:FMN phosphatase YigB (HAD superfamily)